MCKDSARRAKKKGTCSFSFSKPQPILSKDSARRAKNRANRAKNEVYFNFSEVQPVLSNNKISLLNFVFPSRSLYYQKIVQGERKTEQTKRKMKFTSIFPRCSRFYQKRKNLVHFLFPSRSLYYLTLEISGRSRISPNAIIPCVQAPPHHRPLRQVSAATPLSLACRDGAATCMPPTNLRSNDCRARRSPGYSTAANWANP